jgi:CspA family cold shock protein
MLLEEEITPGCTVTHKNTGLRYSVADLGEEEVLLSPEKSEFQDLLVPLELFRKEFVPSDRYSAARGRSRRAASAARSPSGPKAKGRIKKMVRDRGFGFIRGDDGREVFFHRSGLTGADYDALSEGDAVEYVIQEGPRGPRAEHVRAVQGGGGDASPAQNETNPPARNSARLPSL